MTKELLLNGLNNVLNNFLHGMVSTRALPREFWTSQGAAATVFKGPDGEAMMVPLRPLATRLSDPQQRDGVIRNIERGQIRAVVRESYELVMLYCEETRQFDVFKAEPWFQFARILRNVISHKEGGVLREWPHDLAKQGIVNVAWRHRKFDTTMFGEEIVFPPFDALRLAKDFTDFAESKLS